MPRLAVITPRSGKPRPNIAVILLAPAQRQFTAYAGVVIFKIRRLLCFVSRRLGRQNFSI